LPVLLELRTLVAPADAEPSLFRQLAHGYRLAYAGRDGVVFAVAGFRMAENFFYGRHLYVEDLVTSEKTRSKGAGHALMNFVVGIGRAEACHVIHLDSGVQRYNAHRFYLRERFDIVSHHFTRRLE
jgi:GNAT superfamily N-acetyltransferase